jgi:hypothetical protein
MPIKLAHDAPKEARQLFVAGTKMVLSVPSVFRCIMKEIHFLSHFRRPYCDILMGSINFLEALSKECERKTTMLNKELCSIWIPHRVLLCCFHVGRYGAPCSQTLETFVSIIDEDPVFVLVVSLRVITRGHWERKTCGLTALCQWATQYRKHDIVKNSPMFLFGKRYFPLCKFPTFACLCF